MNGYEAVIRLSTKELTPKEKVMIKDYKNAVSIDEATQQGRVLIDYDYHVVLDIHNENSDNKDYTKVIVVSKDGTKFVTGSKSFLNALEDITSEMVGVDEAFQIEAFRKDSKNYKGKQFITCSIV